MSQAIPEVTLEFLQAFADAWNRHDADARRPRGFRVDVLGHENRRQPRRSQRLRCVHLSRWQDRGEKFLSQESSTLAGAARVGFAFALKHGFIPCPQPRQKPGSMSSITRTAVSGPRARRSMKIPSGTWSGSGWTEQKCAPAHLRRVNRSASGQPMTSEARFTRSPPRRAHENRINVFTARLPAGHAHPKPFCRARRPAR